MGLKIPPYEEDLGDGLILRTVRDERDIERYAAFHAAIVSEAEGITCAHLLRHHPEIGYDDFLIVEDKHSGEVVSTICLIPWHCRYEDVMLDVAMLEMVATHPQYRRRGLVRAQIKRFHEIVHERSFDLSIIEGIPYYYRQYGYAYACDHWRLDSLPVRSIPDQPAGSPQPYRLRQATTEDAPLLTQLYQDNIAALQLCTLRSLDYWRFLLQWAQYPVWLVEDLNKSQPVGYLCLLARRDMMVIESGIPNHEVAMAVLSQLKTKNAGEIELGWPQTNTLVRVGRSLGSKPLPADQWLLRIPDLVPLLAKIGPVLERRLAASDCAGLTTDLCLNLFRQAFLLRFKEGKLLDVVSAGFVDASMGADGGDLCIPPEAFVRLLFGYRNLDELQDAWPDIVVKPKSRYLLETIFPKIASYFWMPYLYCGATL